MDFEQRLAALFSDENDNGTVKGTGKGNKDVLKLVQTVSQRNVERKQQEKQEKQRRKREVFNLTEQLAEDPLAGEADPAVEEEKLQDIKKQVGKELGDVDDLSEEPDTFMHVIKAIQALPRLDLEGVEPMLQQILQVAQPVTDSGDPPRRSSKAAEAAFRWLLRGSYDQMIACPSSDFAKAVFTAVCSSSRELAAAAYDRFLVWCGMSELQRGCLWRDVTEESWVAQLDSSKPGLSDVQCRTDLQHQPTAAWLPAAEDFVQSFAALGCSATAPSGGSSSSRRSSAAAAAAAVTPAPTLPGPSEQQQGEAGSISISNIKLLLQLLIHVCRLQSPACSRLPYSLGGGVQGAAACKQLAVLLLQLLLDKQLAEANCTPLLAGALEGLIEVLPEAEWDRVEQHLLDTLDRGLGPSNRSLLYVLNQLPLTARGALLRQQAALQLLRKLTPQGKKQSAAQFSKSYSSPRDVHRELVKLLGQVPGRALMSRFVVKDKEGKDRQDVWALLDLLESAHMVLWTDMMRQGVIVEEDIIKWFIKWIEAFERGLERKLQSHRVRNTLTELANAYRFWGSTNLCAVPGSGGGSSGMEVVDEEMMEVE